MSDQTTKLYLQTFLLEKILGLIRQLLWLHDFLKGGKHVPEY